MKLVSFKDSKVISYLNENFISISVNTDHEKALADKWKVKGLPLIWFLDSEGSKLSNRPGYVEKEQLLSMLKYIGTKSYDKMSFRDFLAKQ